jgi:hypothetical protein
MSDNLSDLPSEFSDGRPRGQKPIRKPAGLARSRHPKIDQQDAATHPKAKGDAARNDRRKAIGTANNLPA